MSLTPGALTLNSVTSTTASLTSAVATGGTGPYTYQWYKSTQSGFSPGAGNIISGATSLSFIDTGLIPLTTYYYKVVVTDTGNSNATATSSQLEVDTTSPVLNPNQFAQTPYLGQIDLRYNYNTVSAQIDTSQATALFAGAAVKIVDSADGTPKLIGVTSDTDEVFGFINFDIKTIQYVAGSRCEISQAGNVIYLYSTGAISRGSQVIIDTTTMGGVAQVTGSSTSNIVGWAYDKSASAGTLIRIKLVTPSFSFDS